jgi:hypothetical protein
MGAQRPTGRVARMRLVPIGILTLLLTVGCAVPDPDSTRSAGDRATAARAEQIGRWLDNRPRAMQDPLDLARAVLGEPRWTGTEVLSATGNRRDGSAELLLRLTARSLGSDGQGVGTRCHLLTQTGVYHLFTPQPRDCPPGATALTPPPEAPEPTLPPGYADRLAAALRALPPAQRADPAAVEAAARRLLGANPAAVRTATAPSGTVGLAVSAARYDCVLAAVDGSVSVWVPPRIYLEPGEGGCSADAAAARQLQRSPH